MGLRRRRPVRPQSSLWQPRTICVDSSIARTPLGLGVILDVVYNHLGPDGNFLAKFAPRYFSERYKNEWGEAINFDDDAAGGPRVRRRECRVLDRRISSGRPSPRRDTADLRRVVGPRAGRDVATCARRCRRTADSPDCGERAAGRARRCGRSSTTASASMRCGTTTSTTPPWLRSPAAARRTTPTTAAHRRNSSRSPNGAFSIRGSVTRGSSERRGTRRPSASRRRGS